MSASAPSDDMLSRGLRLLTVLADHPAGLGVSAAARAAGLPVSSAHRLLGRLAAERFVSYDEDARRYALGPRVLELSRGFQRSPAGYSVAAAPLQRLASRTGLPAIAGVLQGSDVLLVLTAQGTQHLQLRSAEGTRNPWHATSLGKALVAALPEARREELLAAPLASVTPRTRNDPGLLREELHRVRDQGWAEVDEENEIGVRSVAITVPRASGTPSLAVSLGATVVLTSTEELRSHLPALRDCVEDVGARMHA
ncbi:IclR family transcriptional regulator [Streptomyces tubbatahanensis]|uniref:IclR family transcriptional regulator n=1 Tax=Streptomyces tubbatahanensis TaxID=2923272 RepID=A0ABY3XTN5_9ACTN|nr:IclR family transcriptional regulator [Streptomyces tubbatahanensis]UNS97843.1 IclR family transcriptional regulator [Streptomyces tubbatahanensis]